MKRYFTTLVAMVIFWLQAFSQYPTIPATRTSSSPKIDGSLNDAAWNNVTVASLDIDFFPEYGKIPTQKTEVKIIYDNAAIYIGAMMYDTAPSKINRQLSARDENVNADNFIIGFDTYNDDLNGYRFIVTAAGVQSDEKVSVTNNSDRSWDGVWQSAIAVTDKGWICEFKIPYSVIRFPTESPQDWGLQYGRNIARTGELALWSPVDPKISGILRQWGTLTGLENISPPLRLSFSPYLTAGVQIDPVTYDPPEYATSKFISGGMDVKYGINESFTLDATLIPDFGQVQSDNLVLNVSPFETQFDERRPFFTEGTEIFNQHISGPGLTFYSRRIGGIPFGYNDVYYNLNDGEVVYQNPYETKLYNAIKFSGRTNKGLGIGVLNAVSRPTYATIKNQETGVQRQVLTNPLSNYSVIVFDQALKNNSKISLENTNVWREGAYTDANVTSVTADIRNKKNSWEYSGFVNYSQRYNKELEHSPQTGAFYQLGLSDIKGKFTWFMWHQLITPNYNQNDLGILYYSNEMTNGIGYNYNNQELKKGKFTNVSAWGSLNNKTQVEPMQYEEWEGDAGIYGQLKNFMNGNVSIYTKPVWYYDYYEPRIEGEKFYRAPFVFINASYGTDYRKKFVMNFGVSWGESTLPKDPYYGFYINPYWNVTDRFTLGYSLNANRDNSNYGFVDFYGDDIIFGRRNTSTVINSLTVQYVFNPKMNINFRARYYWGKVQYEQFYTLLDDGNLGPTDFTGNYDINFNVFNIDAVYSWEFAPGSYLNVIWKNNIQQYDDFGRDNYFTNCGKTFETPQSNGLSVKLIYYFDVLYLKKKTG